MVRISSVWKSAGVYRLGMPEMYGDLVLLGSNPFPFVAGRTLTSINLVNYNRRRNRAMFSLRKLQAFIRLD